MATVPVGLGIAPPSHEASNSLLFHRFASSMDADPLVHGILLKLGNVHRTFKSRYFVLYNNRKLAYWPSETAKIYGKDPINVIGMQNVRAVKIVNKPPKQKKSKKGVEGDAEDEIGDDIIIDFEKSRYFCFELVTKFRTYLLCCDDALHFNDWIMHLNNAVFGKKLYKGWFIKQGAKAKSWRKRWFVVYDTMEMRYYENQKGSNPKGAIKLTQLTEIKIILDTEKYPKHKNAMELMTPDRVWVLSAPTDNDRQLWFDRLCDLIESTGYKKCFRLNPLYKSYLFQLNTSTQLWNLLYFALTEDHLYYFESAKQCVAAQSMACFDNKAKFHQAMIGGFIPIKNPQFNICDADICTKYNREYLFELDTSFSKLILSSKRPLELEEWQTSFRQISDEETIHKYEVEQDEEKLSKVDGYTDNLDMLHNVMMKKYEQHKKKKKKRNSKAHSTSNSLSMITHFPGVPKNGASIKNRVRGRNIEAKEEAHNNDTEGVKDGATETKLPAPKPRKKSASYTTISPPSLNYKNYMMKRLGGAGITGKIQHNTHLNTRKSTTKDKTKAHKEIARSRSRSRSLNDVQFDQQSPPPPKEAMGAQRLMDLVNTTRNRVDMFSITSRVSSMDAGISSLAVNSSSMIIHDSLATPSLGPLGPKESCVSALSDLYGRYKLSLTIEEEQKENNMLAMEADAAIVRQLMLLGFVSKEQCEKAAIATNNRSVEEASQWLYHNAADVKHDDGDINIDFGEEEEAKNHKKEQLFEFQMNDIKELKRGVHELSDKEHNEISQILDAADRGNAYFEKGFWKEAIREYTMCLNEINYDQEAQHPFAFTFYCLRSECYRKLKKLEKAERDTQHWIKLIWTKGNFEYIRGCVIGSAVYIDLKKYTKARKLVARGLEINPQETVLQKRLNKLNEVLTRELERMSAEIDEKYLEYDVDEIKMSDEYMDGDHEIRESKEDQAAAVISEWDEIIDTKLDTMLEKESAAMIHECSEDIAQCPCCERIIAILTFYDKWCKTQETATILDRISIYNVVAYLRSYSLHQLMNDYIHIKERHVDNKSERSEIFDYFISSLPKCESLSDCKCFVRNNRNRREIDAQIGKFCALYFNFSASGEAHDILTMQILDSLHTFCIHSMQCVMLKVPQEMQQNHNEILSQFLEQPQNAFNAIDADWNKMYQFKTNITEENESDILCIGTTIDDKYDIGLKYKTLKRELLNNSLCRITEPQWFMCLLRANILKQTYKAKQWLAKGVNDGDRDLNEECALPRGLPIPITHLLVLLLYTNNSYLQSQFKDRGFTRKPNESLLNFQQRHREIANVARILEECIVFYGGCNDFFMRNAIFYHGLNAHPAHCMDSFEFHIAAPLLITLEPSLAMIVCNEANNSIIKFRKPQNRDCKLLDISWLTDNPQNNTFLTIESKFDVLDIIDKYQSNEVFITAIKLFRRIISGYYIEDLLHPQQVFQYIILALMSNMSEGYAENSNIPPFIQSIFDHIVNNLDEIWIIQSQYEQLGNNLRTCFFDIQEDCITTGAFYDFWTNNLQPQMDDEELELAVNLAQEFEWNMKKQSDILHFWGLPANESMDGTQCNYVIVDADEDEEQEYICFVPFIKKNKNNVSIGMRLKEFEQTQKNNYSVIELQYNLFCKQLSFAMSHIAHFDLNSNDRDTNNENECVAFNINQIKTLNSFHFAISLRVLCLE